MEKIWFINTAGMIQGPYSTAEIEQDLASGRWTLESLIWWRGQKEWISLSTWQQELPNLEMAKQYAIEKLKKALWYVEQGGFHQGPMSHSELIEFLQTHSELKSVRVWTDRFSQWTKVFECRDILQDLGIQKRVNARAPIVGTMTIHSPLNPVEDKTFDLLSISEGGFGVQLSETYQPNEVVSATIKSPLLIEPCRVSAAVLYSNESGLTGFQFQQINQEARELISDYVKQYQHTPGVMPSETVDAGWYAHREGVQQGPLTKDELIRTLHSIQRKDSVRVWRNGMSKWGHIFDFNELMIDLGLDRRTRKRAPFAGLLCLVGASAPTSVEVVSVSEGGLGLKSAGSVKAGAVQDWLLKSQTLKEPLRVRGHLTFVDEQGYASFQFDEISTENIELLRDYVGQFHGYQEKAA